MPDCLMPPSRNPSSPELPPPDAAAEAHSQHLRARIREVMEQAGGALPFDRFMEMALYEPGLGYYVAGSRKFGEAGDFVTAPELSAYFSRCLAHQCAQVLDLLGGGSILEFGAGSGVMAADMLAELQAMDRLPEHYQILELSPDLRQRQRERLAERVPGLLDRVRWLDSLPPVGFRGVVVANELLDAMPVARFRFHQGEPEEMRVVARGEDFAPDWQPAGDGLREDLERLYETLGPFGEDYESEINLRLGPWLAALEERLDAAAVLLIDYGYSQREYYHPERHMGTLICHYRHRAHDDPFRLVGLQDITASVDFTAVAEAGRQAELELAGYTTQMHFLFGNGLERLLGDSDPSRMAEHLKAMEGVKRLTLPSEMGERFKVIALTRGIDQPLAGFALRDFRDRL